MKILNRIKICSKVGMHAWYDTDLGFAIRKPICSVEWPKEFYGPSIPDLLKKEIEIEINEINTWGWRTPFKWLNNFLDLLWLRFR